MSSPDDVVFAKSARVVHLVCFDEFGQPIFQGGPMPGKLYVVATPIGNLSDMPPRGIHVLSNVSLIAAEDTRHSRVLLTHFGISTPMHSCHKFNEDKRGDFFIDALLDGKDIALISDAGTPCISDPGHKLVARAAAIGTDVVPVCGASAVTAALSVSGFDVTRHVFIGFLPRSAKEQAMVLGQNDIGCPIAFYESPLRITKTMAWLAESHPNADICLCNDISKKFEKIYRGTPAEVLAQLQDNPNAQKGEYTCVVCLNAEAETVETAEISLEAQLVDIIINHDCNLKDAAKILHEKLSATSKSNKKAIYAATLRLKELFI